MTAMVRGGCDPGRAGTYHHWGIDRPRTTLQLLER